MHQFRNSPAAAVAAILQEAFASTSQKAVRSQEYRSGAHARLLQLTIGKPFACPFAEGSPQADAFFAGADQGTQLFHANRLQRVFPPSPVPLAGLKGHAYIAARNLNKKVERVQTSAHINDQKAPQ